jgi:hypothetical protein
MIEHSQVDPHEFVHPVIGEAVMTAGGHYVLSKEMRLSYHNKNVLVFVGYGVVDSSCCGVSGCAYALVPGFVSQWKYKKNKDNLPVSRVESIRNEADRKKIRRLIQEKEMVHQVNFE